MMMARTPLTSDARLRGGVLEWTSPSRYCLCLNCSLQELDCLKKIFDWNGNYCSFHLLLFSRGSVGIIAPKGGYNILVIDRGILLVVVYWKYYLTYKNIFYSKECFSYLCGNMCLL